MRLLLYLFYLVITKTRNRCYLLFSKIYIEFVLYIFNVHKGRNFQIRGIPKFILSKECNICIGDDFKMNSGFSFNPIGRNQRSLICVNKYATLKIGNNVGVSSIAIVCQQSIVIGDNVRIGGNTVIYDTDFHSLNSIERTACPEIKNNIKKKQITIGNNVFIGGHCTILKGVQIGDNSIIGAGSVVVKSVPANEIWGGNPAVFLKNVLHE